MTAEEKLKEIDGGVSDGKYIEQDDNDIIALYNTKHYPVMTEALGCGYFVLEETLIEIGVKDT